MIREAVCGLMSGPNPVDDVVRPRSPKREQMVLKVAEQREPKPLRMVIKDYAKSPWGIRTLRVSGLASRRAGRHRRAAQVREAQTPDGLFFTDTRGGSSENQTSCATDGGPRLRLAGFVRKRTRGERSRR